MSKHKIRFFHPLSHFFLTGKKKMFYLLLTSLLSSEVISTASLHGRKTQVDGDS